MTRSLTEALAAFLTAVLGTACIPTVTVGNGVLRQAYKVLELVMLPTSLICFSL